MDGGTPLPRSKRINYDALTKFLERTPKLGLRSPSEAKAGLHSPATKKRKGKKALPPPPEDDAEEGEGREEEEMEVVEEDGPVPSYSAALRGMRTMDGGEEFGEYEVYEEGGWQEEV
jgi:transcription factor IIIB subunit 2